MISPLICKKIAVRGTVTVTTDSNCVLRSTGNRSTTYMKMPDSASAVTRCHICCWNSKPSCLLVHVTDAPCPLFMIVNAAGNHSRQRRVGAHSSETEEDLLPLSTLTTFHTGQMPYLSHSALTSLQCWCCAAWYLELLTFASSRPESMGVEVSELIR